MTSSKNVMDAVYTAMSDTFEGMAFVQISRQEEGIPATDGPDQIWSRVDVKAPEEGFLVVAYSREMGQHIVEALYGMMDEPCSEEMVLDSLREIVNTIIGRCMSLLVPAGQTFELGLPETGTDWPDVGNAGVFTFTTMDGGVLLAAADLDALDLVEEPLEADVPQDDSSGSDDGWGDSSGSDDGWGDSSGSDDGWG